MWHLNIYKTEKKWVKGAVDLILVMILILPLFSCGGSGGENGANPEPSNTIVLSGTVIGLMPNGVLVQIMDGESLIAGRETNEYGQFSFYLQPGVYTILPSQQGYTFDPASKSLEIEEDTEIQFTSSLIKCTLGGTIRGDIETGVKVKIEGEDIIGRKVIKEVTSGDDGNYQFTDICYGHYTITPYIDGYNFRPQNRPINIQEADDLNYEDFEAQGLENDFFTISGKIMGTAMEGVTITLKKDSIFIAEAVSDQEGTFSFRVPDGIYSLVPERLGYTFQPASSVITMNGNNNESQRFTSVSLIGTLKWKVTTGGPIYSGAVVGYDGTIYIGSDDSKLYAMNPNGLIKWSFAVKGGIFASPAIDQTNEIIYIGSYDNIVKTDNYIYAVSFRGQEKWRSCLGDSILSTATIGLDGTLYVGCNDSNLYALNPADGQKKWISHLSDKVSSPIVTQDSTIYVGAGNFTNGGRFYALKPQNGTIKWVADLHVLSRPAVGGDGTIYVGSFDHHLYALYPETGLTKWSFKTGGKILSSPIVGPDGSIYLGSDDKKVYAFKPDGSCKWTSTTEGEVRSSAAVGLDGTIYIGSRDGYLYAFNPTTGAQKWKFLTENGAITSIPAIGNDGAIYVGSQNYSFYAIYGEGKLVKN